MSWSVQVSAFDGFPKAPVLGTLWFCEHFSSDMQKNVISIFLAGRDKFDNMTRAEHMLKAVKIKQQMKRRQFSSCKCIYF